MSCEDRRHACGCRVTAFRTAEDYRDHLPCGIGTEKSASPAAVTPFDEEVRKFHFEVQKLRSELEREKQTAAANDASYCVMRDALLYERERYQRELREMRVGPHEEILRRVERHLHLAKEALIDIAGRDEQHPGATGWPGDLAKAVLEQIRQDR